MIAFEVFVNGSLRYVAGHRDAHVLSLWLRSVCRGAAGVPTSTYMHAHVGVPNPAADAGQLDTLTYPNDPLSIGDEVTIRIVDVDSADPPTKQPDAVRGIVRASRWWKRPSWPSDD